MPTRVVVADASPLNYLVLVEAVDVLPRLFEPVGRNKRSALRHQIMPFDAIRLRLLRPTRWPQPVRWACSISQHGAA